MVLGFDMNNGDLYKHIKSLLNDFPPFFICFFPFQRCPKARCLLSASGGTFSASSPGLLGWLSALTELDPSLSARLQVLAGFVFLVTSDPGFFFGWGWCIKHIKHDKTCTWATGFAVSTGRVSSAGSMQLHWLKMVSDSNTAGANDAFLLPHFVNETQYIERERENINTTVNHKR